MTSEQVTLAERYVLQSPIARGGMATVWQATDEVLARPVAVKVLHPQLAEDDEFLERFRREALAAARLAHPNIVSVFDTGSEIEVATSTERYYIVMEYCGGGTLAQLLSRHEALEPERAVEVGVAICDALDYAHSNGVVHRDIKPPNILITEHGALKVADFGIAKAAFTRGDITTTGALLGTVTYLSPEQVKGVEPDARSDLYSLGVLLHELIAGSPPFAEKTQLATAMAHSRTPPPPLRSVRGGVPRHLEEVVLKALEKDPDDRFQTAEELRVALEPSVAGATAVIPSVTATPSARPEKSRARPPAVSNELRRLLPILLLLAGAVVAALVVPRLLADSSSNGLAEGANSPAGDAVGIARVRDFDPEGDNNSEHPEDVRLAADGEPSTAWSTEDYTSPLQELKSGVGLLFELEGSAEVSDIRVSSPAPGFAFEIRASDEPSDDIDGYEVVDESSQTRESVTLSLSEPTTRRYWVLWITELAGGGAGRAEVGEVEFFGS